MHSTSNLEDGYIGSGKRLWYSIKKYGRENFKMEILEFLPDRSSLKLREKEVVNSDLLKEELCMNLKEGGDGGFSSMEHKKKAQYLGALSSLQIMRNKLQQKEQDNPECKQQRLQRIADTHMEKTGSTNGWKGRSHSLETIEKLKNKKTQVGEKNSQFGKIWIHKDSTSIKILKDELVRYLNEGWIKGRKMNQK